MTGLSVGALGNSLAAIRTFRGNLAESEVIQRRITTGLAVAGPKDDGAIFAIAQTLRGRVAGLGAALNSVNNAVGAVSVALSAAEQISDLLIDMRKVAVQASDASLDTASVDALGRDYFALADQIYAIYTTAELSGTNMIDSGGKSVSAIINDTGTGTVGVAAEDLSDGGGNIVLDPANQGNGNGNAGGNGNGNAGGNGNGNAGGNGNGNGNGQGGNTAPFGPISFSTPPDAAFIAQLDQNISNVSAAMSRLGTGLKRLETQSELIQGRIDIVTVGIGRLVDADLTRESARFEAIQVKQQLGLQALAIANAAPRVLLALFVKPEPSDDTLSA